MAVKILITGGAGYIGTHTCIELVAAGYDIVVVDNLCNSKEEAVRRASTIAGKDFLFYKVDLCDETSLDGVFAKEKPDAVIHFAGLKAVGESVEKPLEYYDNNLVATLNLMKVMRKYNVKNIVFSSSATVYGAPKTVPITEDFPLHTTNPYGTTKLMIEMMMRDFCVADSALNVALLRYFNPVGAHPTGMIGEDPTGIPNNLTPYVARVASGLYPFVRVWGNDYDTPDGTGVRDYIHVVDLAKGHVAAIKKLLTNCGCVTYNLGTGIGYSVLDVIHAFEKASGKKIEYKIMERRAGDIATCYADSSKALKELGWKAELGIDEMCRDSWNWQTKNPKGYN